MPLLDGSEQCVREIAKAIRSLSRQAAADWVDWRHVAKTYTGSTEGADVLIAISSLPAWRPLFEMSGNVVKLNQKGLLFASECKSESLSEIQKISKAVIEYAGRLRDILLEVRSVARIGTVGSRTVQAVKVDHEDEPLPSETPVQICPRNGRPTSGKIVGQESDGSILYVVFDAEIFPDSLPAKLRIDRGFLLKCLADQLERLPNVPPRMRSVLYDGSDDFFIAGSDSLTVGKALANFPVPWTRFLWGPPGAGKTFGLGQIAATLLQRDRDTKILVVAPSNRAVDVAVEEIADRLESTGLGSLIKERRVLRFGYPRKNRIMGMPELLGPSELDELTAVVRSRSKQIEKAEKDGRNDEEIALLRASMLEAQDQVRNAVASHVAKAAIVGTTTTLAYLSTSPVSRIVWSTVLVDEVTMVPPAMCTFLSSLAKDRFLLAGDPRQLGPVYENGSAGSAETSDYEWMGRDIFEVGRLSTGLNRQRCVVTTDSRLSRITSQRRCAPAIWDRVKHLYPEVANRSDANQLKDLAELAPSPGASIVVLDTSEVDAKCEAWRGSWQNPLSADLAMDVALTAAADASRPISIAIITPYRAQVRLLRQQIRAERKALKTPLDRVELESGTVHQFQGSGADVVIFDLVDGRGRSNVGKLLRDDAGARLVNVAITRAKGKLVVVADKRWCECVRIHGHNELLGQLVLGRPSGETLRVEQRPMSSTGYWMERDKTESPIERLLLDAIAKYSTLSTVRGQVLITDTSGIPVSRADFAFSELKLAIYCDGRQWHLQQDRWQYDLRQRRKLAELGWTFLVFTGAEINRNADDCAKDILKTYLARQEELKRRTA